MKHYFKTHKLIFAVALLYTVIITTVCLNRFWQYEAFYYDHGMMEGTAYQVSQFKMPLHDREYGRVSIYIDHLYPSLQLVLAPFYWLANTYETPIIVMCILIGLSVLVGYEVAKKLVRNQLMIYALLFAYMLYIGMQNAIIFLVHDITIQIPFLMLLFWAVINKRIKLFYLLLFINLGFKESVTITTLAIGVFMFLYDRKWWKHSITTIIISVLYAYVSSKIIVPYFYYQAFGHVGQFRYSPEISSNLIEMASRFVSTYTKKQTILVSLASFGFLPLFSPATWLMVIQDFAQRFVLIDYDNPFRQGMNLHYSANIVVILFFSSTIAVNWLERQRWYKYIVFVHAFLIFTVVAIFHRFTFRGPLGLFYNPDFYRITSEQGYMNDFVARIPKKGKIMVQNNLAVRFTHNDLYILLNEQHIKDVDPDVIALDFRPGQNINNYWPSSEDAMKKMAGELLSNQRYKVFYREDHRYIFVKKNYN